MARATNDLGDLRVFSDGDLSTIPKLYTGGVILVIGEALIDLIGAAAKPSEFSAVLGGANANVALAFAAREQPHRFLGRISRDSFGQQIRSQLLSRGVNLDLCISTGEPTTLAIANIDSEGVAHYSFYINGTADWGWQPGELPGLEQIHNLEVEAIQFGCLTMAIPPGSSVVFEWLKTLQGHVTLSHDLNLRPALGFERELEFKRIAELNEDSDIIKASDADLEWLFDLAPGSDLDSICHEWSTRGRLVVLTRGERGASCYRDGIRLDVSAPSIELVDTVGAGDTFMASLLAKLSDFGALGARPRERLKELSDSQLREALSESVVAAGIACERRGCQPPKLSEIRSRLS